MIFSLYDTNLSIFFARILFFVQTCITLVIDAIITDKIVSAVKGRGARGKACISTDHRRDNGLTNIETTKEGTDHDGQAI